MNQTEKEFQSFLENFVPLVAAAAKRNTLAEWELDINKTDETVEEATKASIAYDLIFTDRLVYEELLAYQKSGEIQDRLLKRQLDGLVRTFRGSLLPHDLIEEMSSVQSELEGIFTEFRPVLDGKEVSDNDLKLILENEKDVALRTRAWEASKQVGIAVAPLGLKMVKLNNQAAQQLGFANYFRMALELDELDVRTVIGFFDQQLVRSEEQWRQTRPHITSELAKQFSVDESQLGPWAWKDFFGHEDPIEDTASLNKLLDHQDVVAITTDFYDSMGFDIRPIIERSDLYERKNKNQHAFCFPMDRGQDVRILANIEPTWHELTTMIHESGHAVHDISHNPKLPWLLRTYSHTITTEAAAGISEYYVNHGPTIKALLKLGNEWDPVLNELTQGYKRTQLLFSRWGNVVTRFEQALYEDPEQNLQDLYWSLVERYQGIKRPPGREHAADWACKVHTTTSPGYYQNYLLSYVTASQIRATLREVTKSPTIFGQKTAGEFLKNNFFALGDTYPWYETIEKITGKPLSVDDWIKEIK